MLFFYLLLYHFCFSVQDAAVESVCLSCHVASIVRTARDVLARVAMEESINGFVFKRKKKKRKLFNGQGKTVAGGSLGSFAKSQVDTTKNIKNLPPMSNNLPTYPDTAYPASVRGPTFDNIKGSVFEKDAHRLINLFNNAVNKEMESINKVFPADGPYGVFNFLATTVSSDFLARAKTILLASAKQQEIRVKSNAPYVRPLPMNDQLRAREAVLTSLIDKFEREKESWEKVSSRAVEEDSQHEKCVKLLENAKNESEESSDLKDLKPDIVLGAEMSETLKRFVVQVDQIYEVLEKSRKNGESLEKQRKSLSEIIHATAHYSGAGSSLDMIKGLTRTSKNDGALIRAFTKEASDNIMGPGNSSKVINKKNKMQSRVDENDSSTKSVANGDSIINENEGHQKGKTQVKEVAKRANPLNLLKNLTA